jgi:beta-glucosidase
MNPGDAKPALRSPLLLPTAVRRGWVRAALFAWIGVATAWGGNSAAEPTPRFTLHWLERYSVINREAERGHADLIYIGDSIVEDLDLQGRAVWAHYYAGRQGLNLGISGDRTQHVLWRLRHGNLGRLEPRLAIVMIGQNNAGHNSSEEIAAGVAAIVATLREQLPRARILLLAIFPRGERPTPERAVLARASQLAARLADGRSVVYLDVNSVFLRPDGSIPSALMSDFEHPTAQGCQVWAEAIEPMVAALMGDHPVAPLR